LKRIYTWAAKPASRTVTVSDLRANKGVRKYCQVSVNTAEESHAAGMAGIDMIACNADNVELVRQGNNELFLTAGLGHPKYATESDVVRGAFKALELGADAIITARSMSVVSMLANEDVPVMGHLGLVPRKSTWVGGLRAVGKTGDEAFELYQRFRRLEEAGAFSVEAELIPGPVMKEISQRSGLITVSLGSGIDADVMYLFMQDICGDNETPPRHARAYGNIAGLKKQIYEERIRSLKAFKEDIFIDNFPSEKETAGLDSHELDKFMENLEKLNG
jgi:3-methyl-2-oxobutanoate hydroxymethyltransferase